MAGYGSADDRITRGLAAPCLLDHLPHRIDHQRRLISVDIVTAAFRND